METTKTSKDIFDYSKTLESLMPEIGPEARNTLFNQIMRYQNTHDSLVAAYAKVARSAQRSKDNLAKGIAVSTLDLISSDAERIAELVYSLKAQADSLTAMQYALGVKIEWIDFIAYD